MEKTHSFKWLSSLVIIAALLSSCKQDPVIEPVPVQNPVSGTLRLHVVPEWEGAPLAMFSEYANISDYRTTVELLKMYFSEIQLVTASGSVPVTDIVLFNLDIHRIACRIGSSGGVEPHGSVDLPSGSSIGH